MPTVAKRSPRLRFEFVPARKQSTLGGLPAPEALAQQFDLWNKVRRLPGLDPRTRTSHGYRPKLIVTQLASALVAGRGGGAGRACGINRRPQPAAVRAARPSGKGGARPRFGKTILARPSSPCRARAAPS